MKIYKIYKNRVGDNKAVKIGWSWSAFCFTLFWVLGKKIWTLTALTKVILVITLGLAFIAVAITPEFAIKISADLLFIYAGYSILGLSILVGLKGNQWYENKLLADGYRFQAIIVADSSKEAVGFHLKKSVNKYLIAA